jgi:hypothetical protein
MGLENASAGAEGLLVSYRRERTRACYELH